MNCLFQVSIAIPGFSAFPAQLSWPEGGSQIPEGPEGGDPHCVLLSQCLSAGSEAYKAQAVHEQSLRETEPNSYLLRQIPCSPIEALLTLLSVFPSFCLNTGSLHLLLLQLCLFLSKFLLV